MTEDKNARVAWHGLIAVASTEKEDMKKSLENIDDLDDAPDQLVLRFEFPSEEYSTDMLRTCVTQWLQEVPLPWAVVGVDRVDNYCSVMLAGRSIYEVLYGF